MLTSEWVACGGSLGCVHSGGSRRCARLAGSLGGTLGLRRLVGGWGRLEERRLARLVWCGTLGVVQLRGSLGGALCVARVDVVSVGRFAWGGRLGVVHVACNPLESTAGLLSDRDGDGDGDRDEN